MKVKDVKIFKDKLLKEKADLEAELSTVGEKSDERDDKWEATAKGMEVDSADESEMADKLEELEDNSGVVFQLQSQLDEVNAALKRIEDGTYGICEKCGKDIEPDRLEANPSARVSIKHGH